MCPAKQFLSGVILGTWAFLCLNGDAHGQAYYSPSSSTVVTSARGEWEQRALRRYSAAANSASTTVVDGSVPSSVASDGSTRVYRRNWAPARPVSAPLTPIPAAPTVTPGPTVPTVTPAPQRAETVQGNLDAESIPPDAYPMGAAAGVPAAGMPGEGCYGGACGAGCGSGCPGPGDVWDGCEDGCARGCWIPCHGPLFRNLSLFAGVQGFKNAADGGYNGNFGFHEGFNWGVPLGGFLLGDAFRELGFQPGLNAVQSNLYGADPAEKQVAAGESRNQLFFTAGLFHRAVCGGLQWGVVFDYLRDAYYLDADLKQIRAEVSFVNPCCGEWGFWGAFGTSRNDVLEAIDLEPLNLYAFFWRRYFSGGGEGRLWAGFTGDRDGLLGGDLHIPLGSAWALENSVTYLLPGKDDEGAGLSRHDREGWALSMHLVWYPGRMAACEQQNPFRPLLPVADNGSLIINPKLR